MTPSTTIAAEFLRQVAQDERLQSAPLHIPRHHVKANKIEAAAARLESLDVALSDVLAAFDQDRTTITGERVEAWRAALSP